MGQGFGQEMPRPHVRANLRGVTRYLVIVPLTDGPIARLFLENREQAAEFDANTEEVSSMIKGITPSVGATGAEWDKALSAHSETDRAQATIYDLASHRGR
ncbi:MAG: hypothetical protein ACI9I0_000118 [Rhodoferax sp.]|jgi:hypothetical protein